MVGIYGQVIPAVGWTAGAFDSIGDDDPADHEIIVPYQEISTDPDWLNEPMFGIQLNVPGDEWVRLPGQEHFGIRRDVLYGDY